ncbi:A-kinase anchor protein 10, mitochondrial [Chamberlinius hualienensis]
MSLFWKKFAGSGGSPKLQPKTNDTVSPNTSPCAKSPSLPVANGTVALSNYHDCETSSFVLPNGCIKRSSRLSQGLDDVLQDGGSRQYFIQFLELRDALRLLQFWLDVDSFESSAKSRLLSQSRRLSKRSSLPDQQSNLADEIDGGHKTNDELGNINNSQPNNDISNPSSSEHSEDDILLNIYKSVAEDAVKIFAQYLAKDAVHPVGVSDEQRDEIASKICSEDGRVDPTCFLTIQQFVYTNLQKEYFNLFLQSVFYCKYQLDVLTAGCVTIVDILYNENALVYFMEFMEQEGQRELVEFWLTVDNFYMHYAGQTESEYDSSQVQDDAMVLYEKYFSLQALCPLGFSDEIRFEVEQNICRVGGPLPTCFEGATRLVLHVLDQTYLGTFLGSQMYVKYLTELVNTVQTRSYSCDRRRRAGSDASSEHSTHTVNTLLAMDGSQPGVTSRKIIKKFEDEDMQIDTRTFVPDALWRRPLAGRLRMGYVNDLGQYITDFEPEPDRRRHGDSRFTKAVKKLVYKDEDKAKEDMALQVARMIIHEVTSVTLKSHKSSVR